MANIIWVVLLSLFVLNQLAAADDDDDHYEEDAETASNNQEHLQHHLDEVAEGKMDAAKMGKQEKKILFFTLHDLDKDGSLDGLELFRALAHDWVEKTKKQSETQGLDEQQHSDLLAKKRKSAERRAAVAIDKWLTKYDKDQNGYITKVEYMEQHADEKF